MPFTKGQSGNKSGRPKGVKDKITPEVQALARSILEQPAYLKRLTLQAVEGTLHPKIESMLWAYAYGAPKQENQGAGGVTVNLGLISLPEGQTRQQLQAIELKALPGETEH